MISGITIRIPINSRIYQNLKWKNMGGRQTLQQNQQ